MAKEITFESSFDSDSDDFIEESFALDNEEEMEYTPRSYRGKGCPICAAKTCRRDCFDLD